MKFQGTLGDKYQRRDQSRDDDNWPEALPDPIDRQRLWLLGQVRVSVQSRVVQKWSERSPQGWHGGVDSHLFQQEMGALLFPSFQACKIA